MEAVNQTSNSPFVVTIVGFDDALASSITGAMDMFALAGVAWQRIHQEPIQQYFTVQLASLDGTPIHCINQHVLQASVALDRVQQSDIVMIPTIGGEIGHVLEQTRGLLPHLIRLHRAGSDLASNCTGAFILANAGLLDGRKTTTHWGYAEQFLTMFPKALLQPQQLITEDERVFCAGGGMAWFDLVLKLIERYCGQRVAADTAKTHVVDFNRGQQAAYAPLQRRKFHHDQEISELQDWLEQQYRTNISIESMAVRIALTPRTMIRRFKRATGQTPQQYLQFLRVEEAKRLLGYDDMPISQIVNEIGYEDVSSFTRLFKRLTGFSPGYYRKSFQKINIV
ncbi:helix-turn-helix domain-containing protein [Alteromonas sp. ASW11-36]|uniref:Helix-turn-helix domain-containing protein n=2 Tax=Alteromonas arenosi TaxID=3055817 RepID=A0ABT7SX44_9ALTE|nr:helix-turn-helix domain-containing protein [Alteromonas sp. ASW11-36]MDM7860748.1 helix-turn-helix domain-containing protein [Alteromonas sp. ASW11-36]